MSRRIAVVGACGGIGAALVGELSAHGDRVAALDMADALETTDPDVEIRLPIDAREAGSVADAFTSLDQAWDGLDGLVNLCGFLTEKAPIASFDADIWDGDLAGNLTSAFHIVRASLPLLHKGDRPAGVLVSSGLGVRPRPEYGAYASAKAGLIALAKQVAIEEAPKVRFNTVAPSAVNTAFLTGGLGKPQRAAIDTVSMAAGIPLGRIAEPADIVGPVRFLLSDASRYMTGQTLHVNGGSYMH